jgi:hypothetical protein
LSLQPITAYRNSPPVSGVGDKQLERTRREFLDLIKTDERRHDGGGSRENRDQKSGDQQQNAQETARQVRLAADLRAKEPSFLPASATPARSTAARPMRDGSGQQGVQQTAPAAAPVAPRQPSPIGAPPPVEARPQLPPAPAGSQLVAPAAGPNAQDAGQALQGFRLSSQVPREVAERIAEFMRTGSLNRAPFSFAPLNHLLEADPVLTPEQEADLAVASLIAEAAPHMRLPDSMLMDGGIGEGGFRASTPGDAAASIGAQAAIRAQAALQPPTLVPTEPQMQPVQSSVSRGAANPLFGPSDGELGDFITEDEDLLVDLMAGSRMLWPQSRIA